VIVRRVGRGAAANVYLAYDLEAERWRAMKVMHPNVAQDRDMRTRFFREAKLMALIEHPHVVRVDDVGEGAAIPYMVMEYVRGGCVLDWLREHGAMPAQLALQVARDVANGLQATHDMRVVHRDVKPHNVLVQLDGSCKLTDFGIAKLSGETFIPDDGEEIALTRVGTAMGTVAFMPPEQQHNAASVDHRADLYSLGATLFTLLRCKAPQDLYVADPEDTQFAGIPRSVVDILLKACAYKPENRYRNAKEMVEALEQALDGLDSLPDDTPSLAMEPELELPVRPPSAVDREHVEDLLDLVATGHAMAYNGEDDGTLSSEEAEGDSDSIGSRLTIDDYTLTPEPAERDPLPPDDLPPESELTIQEPESMPTPVPPPGLEEDDGPGRSPLVIAASVAVVLALLLMSVGGFGLIAALQADVIRQTAAERDQLADALIAEVDDAEQVVDRLTAKGADSRRLGEAMERFDSAVPGVDKLAKAVAFVELVDTQHGAVVTRFGPQGDLDTAVEGLEQRAHAMERAQQELLQAQASVGGSLALSLGLAESSETYGQ